MPTNGRLTRSVPRGASCVCDQFKLGRFDFRKDAPAAFEEQGTFRSQCDARAAMEKAHA
jgi:hypothetical protein